MLLSGGRLAVTYLCAEGDGRVELLEPGVWLLPHADGPVGDGEYSLLAYRNP